MTLDPVLLWLISAALMLVGVIGVVLPGVPGVIAVFGRRVDRAGHPGAQSLR